MSSNKSSSHMACEDWFGELSPASPQECGDHSHCTAERVGEREGGREGGEEREGRER